MAKKYIDADRLIEYLEKEADKEFKKTEENANSPVLCHFHNGCRMQALDAIDFIKKLQQEQPSEDLEEEIHAFWNKCSEFQPPFCTLEVKENGFAVIARHFANWQKSQMPMPEDTVIFQKGIEEGKRQGREEMFEELRKISATGVVICECSAPEKQQKED